MINEACPLRSVILGILYIPLPSLPLEIDLTCVLGHHQIDLGQNRKFKVKTQDLLQMISPPPPCKPLSVLIYSHLSL